LLVLFAARQSVSGTEQDLLRLLILSLVSMEKGEGKQRLHALGRLCGDQAIGGYGCLVLSGETLQIRQAQSKQESLTFGALLETIACLFQSGGLTLCSHIQQQLEVLDLWPIGPQGLKGDELAPCAIAIPSLELPLGQEQAPTPIAWMGEGESLQPLLWLQGLRRLGFSRLRLLIPSWILIE
jgi:hypothetical protein